MAQVAINPTSVFDPAGEARVWARRVKTDLRFLYLFGATDQHIQALLEKGHKDLFVIALDPDRFNTFDHERVVICHTMNDLGQSFPNLEVRQKGFRVASIPSYRSLYPELYGQWAEWLHKMGSATAVDLVTSHRFSREWQKNTLVNMKWLKRSTPISQWFGKWEKKPFIIVSAGPSLNEAIPYLQKLQGKAFICAAGGTVPVLEKHGIQPSAYIAFDAGIANWRGHFRGLKIKPPLVYDLMLHPFCMAEHIGEKYVMQIWPFN